MLAVNMKWHPIRLTIKRIRTSDYEISRGGVLKGRVKRNSDGEWVQGKADSKGVVGQFGYRSHPSFRTAVLAVSRNEGLYFDESENVQDYGLMRVRRFEIGNVWFTVTTDPKGDRYPSIHLDFPNELKDMNDLMQSIVRKLLVVADEHLLRTSSKKDKQEWENE